MDLSVFHLPIGTWQHATSWASQQLVAILDDDVRAQYVRLIAFALRQIDEARTLFFAEATFAFAVDDIAIANQL